METIDQARMKLTREFAHVFPILEIILLTLSMMPIPSEAMQIDLGTLHDCTTVTPVGVFELQA